MGTIVQVGSINTSLGLLLQYFREATKLYDRVAESARRDGKHVREIRDTAICNLVDIALRASAHKNDLAKYRYKDHITLQESIRMRIEDAANDFGYEWTS